MIISEIRADARQKLTGKWGRGAFIVFGFILLELIITFSMAMPLVGLLVALGSLIITIPLNYGLEKSFFDLYHGEDVSLFDFASNGMNFFSQAWSVAWRKFLALLLPTLVTFISGTVAIFSLFSMLILLVPAPIIETLLEGIVDPYVILTKIFLISTVIYICSAIFTALFGLRYVLARLISIDNPELSGKECVKQSVELMKGNKINYILLNLSFIGWAILAALTFGIGMFWLTPYIQVSIIAFYRALKPKDNTVLYKADEIINGVIL